MIANPTMSIEITNWLRGLGLQQYERAFRDNDVGAEVLPKLTGDDLISIGVTSVGHRRKLLAAIAALAREAPAAAAPAPARDSSAPADVEQGAKLWELRAAVSLARLLRDQGRRRGP